MFRKLYYLLPVTLRYTARKIFYYPLDLLRKRAALVPPSGLIYTGGGDFEKQGKDWLLFFKRYGNLNENANVLDIGSGIGRNAIPLVGFLKGDYYGFDAVKQGVDWCNNKIASKYPNFHFVFVDLFNDLYKSKGIDAATYQFDFKKNYFDLAYAISVFTHMVPSEVENYFRETNKVLKKDGKLIATFFILDDESKKLMAQNQGFNFEISFGEYAIIDKKVVSANVAYDKDFLYKMIEKQGFIVENSFNGYWSGRNKTDCVDFQDVLVLKKKHDNTL